MPDKCDSGPPTTRENIKRLNDKLTLIFTGVGVVAGVKPDLLWPAIHTHWAVSTICLVLGVAPIQEFAFGCEKVLKVIYWAKWLLLWFVVLLAFLFVRGKLAL